MFPWILCCILLIVVFFLITKIIFIEKSIDEIHTEFQERLSSDTNTLIDISSSDPHLRKLASEINIQLRLLRKERHRYQQGDLELKEAITNISHDLRTPLTAINGYLDLLEREEKSETVHCYLSQIQNRTDVLKNLTEELFRYSVVTSFQELKPERMDVVRALEESLLSFYAVMQEKGIQPEIELPEKPVFRELDAGAVNRIFSNIISNALKYSDGDLSVVMDKNGCVTFSNTAHNLNYVTVGRLFDRFYTVEASRNSTGLGLSIAKLLIERMGGSIGAIYKKVYMNGGVLIMKKYLKEILILLIQLFMFYVFPLFAGPTDVMGMIVLLILATLLLSILIGSISNLKVKYLYPIIIAITFVPSVFIYYNETALIHSLWYLAVSSFGLIIGMVIHKLILKK